MGISPNNNYLPLALYQTSQVRELDRLAIERFQIAGSELMRRAGRAAFDYLQRRWPQARNIIVFCGPGNNGGDGYVVAQLAKQSGFQVRLIQLGDSEKLSGEAKEMAEEWRAADGEVERFGRLAGESADLIVDALLGTGLERPLAGEWREAVEAINSHPAPVLAIDAPSGLQTDRGRIMGVAVKATASITFVGLKQGMFTAHGADCCGDIVFDSLQIPERLYATQVPAAKRTDWRIKSSRLEPRRRSAHKGDFGHVLLVGGDLGFSGAIRLAAEAAARAGAGLVSVATQPKHSAVLNQSCPELMCHGVASIKQLKPLLKKASVVALGPGLGRSDWSREMFSQIVEIAIPLVVDADALNWLAQNPLQKRNWILTPHPGEAARLLQSSSTAVNQDRYRAAAALQEKYGGVVVLKGAGSLICSGEKRPLAVCHGGNPGMATAGSGDLLTGIIAAMVAQGETLEEAAEMGVCLHAAAGDMAAKEGERGMLASDLLACMRSLLNPELTDV